jgi:hypothetical protein
MSPQMSLRIANERFEREAKLAEFERDQIGRYRRQKRLELITAIGCFALMGAIVGWLSVGGWPS